MHLVIVSPGFPSKGRPVYVFVQQLVFALVDSGIHVSVIAPQSVIHSVIRQEQLLPKHSKCKTNSGNLFDVFRPYHLSFGRRMRWLEHFFAFICNTSISRILTKIKPDVLYGHFWYSAYRTKNYVKKNNIPLFVACGEGDNALEDFVQRLSDKEKKCFVRCVTGVISVSTENKRKCLEYGLIDDKRIIVLPNCVDTSLMYPRDRELFRKELNLSSSDFVILFVGSFVQRKGATRLAKAIDMLDDNDIKVIFVGTPMGGEKDDPICKGIIYKGSVPHESLPKFYSVADVFVLPTLKEGCCNAIVEALACGIPVISSDLAFNDDILNDDNSIRIDPSDSKAIAEAIHTFKSDVTFRETIKHNVLSDAANHSLITRSKRIIAFINEQING